MNKEYLGLYLTFLIGSSWAYAIWVTIDDPNLIFTTLAFICICVSVKAFNRGRKKDEC